MHSNPLAIPCKESWEAGIQANYFARDIGCPTLNMTCMRSKTKEEVAAAQRSTPMIINNELLLHAAMKFSPVVDGVMITEQPFNSLRPGFKIVFPIAPFLLFVIKTHNFDRSRFLKRLGFLYKI